MTGQLHARQATVGQEAVVVCARHGRLTVATRPNAVAPRPHLHLLGVVASGNSRPNARLLCLESGTRLSPAKQEVLSVLRVSGPRLTVAVALLLGLAPFERSAARLPEAAPRAVLHRLCGVLPASGELVSAVDVSNDPLPALWALLLLLSCDTHMAKRVCIGTDCAEADVAIAEIAGIASIARPIGGIDDLCLWEAETEGLLAQNFEGERFSTPRPQPLGSLGPGHGP